MSDFQELYGLLHDFAREYRFQPETERYLMRITTGMHSPELHVPTDGSSLLPRQSVAVFAPVATGWRRDRQLLDHLPGSVEIRPDRRAIHAREARVD
jgi:hypothetical protein